MTAGGVRQTYLYDPASHRLTTADGKARRYDAAGNTIGIGDATLTYDDAGRLASASEQGRVLVTYGYDADGQRIARTETGKSAELWLYDEQGRWLADYDTSGKVTRQAVWMGDYLVGLVEGTKVYYVEPDHLGTPRAVIDPARNATVWRWRPSDDPFGTAPPDEDPDGDGARFVFDLRFPGQRYDAVTGLHYNYRRDYDPDAGRYIQVDPIGLAGGVNPYLYANGSPLRYVDPTGEFGVVGAGVSAVLDLAIQAFQNYRSGCGVLNARNYNWASVGISASIGAIAPGWVAVGRRAWTSSRAMSTLSNQLERARTANRLIKIQGRMSTHKTKVGDVLIPQLGLQGVKAAGNVVTNGFDIDECGCP
nr:RHS repeat-associated core domain-containing protein [Luteibacter yeojuensis]